MLQYIVNGSNINRLLALAALILAFPPIFTKKGHTEGLLMSFSLLIFYTVRGCISLLDGVSATKQSAIRPSQFFAFTEIPAIFASIYFGLKVLPDWIAAPYQWTLLTASPLFVLLEGVCSMIIILECGERCSDVLADASNFLKGLVAAVCFGIFGTSFFMIFDIYKAGLLGVMSASFVASVGTIIIALTVLTVYVEHGTITDAAMLSLYVTYNVWCITRSWKQHFVSAVQLESVFDYFANPSRMFNSLTPQTSVLSAITSLASMFSVEIVVHLMMQMCVFVMAVKMIGRALKKTNPDNQLFVYQDWIFNVLWPSFGKLTVILVYTYAYIVHLNPELVTNDWSWYNPTTWRYVNVVMVLLIYLKHLMTPGDEPVFKLD